MEFWSFFARHPVCQRIEDESAAVTLADARAIFVHALASRVSHGATKGACIITVPF